MQRVGDEQGERRREPAWTRRRDRGEFWAREEVCDEMRADRGRLFMAVVWVGLAAQMSECADTEKLRAGCSYLRLVSGDGERPHRGHGKVQRVLRFRRRLFNSRGRRYIDWCAATAGTPRGA